MLLFGARLWPAIFLGAFLVNLTTAGNTFTSLGIAAGNTLEALAGAWMVQRFAGGIRVFEHAFDVFRFALAASLSALISATIGLTGLALAGFADWANYPSIWLTWWLGDLGGAVMFAPLLVLWRRVRGRSPEGRVYFTYLLLFGGMRFFTSFLRQDPIFLFGMQEGQLLGLIYAVAGAVALPMLANRARLDPRAKRATTSA